MSWTKTLLKSSAARISDTRARLDSWINALSGLGTGRDKTASMIPVLDPVLPQELLEAIYHSDDIANRIVSAVPDECFREPWSVVNKDPTAETEAEQLIQERTAELAGDLDQLGVRHKFREAMTWGRLYGVGAVFISADDGQPEWEPLDWERCREVKALTVLDKRDLVPWRWYADMRAPQFGDVAVYLVQPVGVYVGAPYHDTFQAGSQVLLVHESRLIRFGGELTSKRLRLANQGSDYSVLQRCYRALQMTNDNWQSAAALLADASQGVLKIEGLIDMISQQPDVMTQRFQFMDLARSVVRSIVLDAKSESFERVPSRFEGIPDMLEQTWKRLAAAARMPLTVLMGMSPAGMNATGESDIRWWYDQIAATQEQAVKPNLERLLKLLAACKGWDEAENWSVSFHPLWQMTSKEEAECHYTQAQADKIYLEAGVVSPEEAALSRFGGGAYSNDTQVDIESRRAVLDKVLEQMEVEADNQLEKAKNPPPPPVGLITAGQPPPAESAPRSQDPKPPGTVES